MTYKEEGMEFRLWEGSVQVREFYPHQSVREGSLNAVITTVGSSTNTRGQ